MHTASEARLAVLGSPIGHSRSPVLHRAAYAVLGLPWSYEAIEMTDTGLAAFVSSCDSRWRGLSLTMPLKHSVIPLVAELDDSARITGAANTILFSGHGSAAGTELRGFNTDVDGIVRAVRAAGLGEADTVHILGSGATAASAITAAARLGAKRIVLRARSRHRADALVPLANNLGLDLRVHGLDNDDLDNDGLVGDAELVISTLPGGAELGIRFPDELCRHALLLDVAYDPWPSALAVRWGAADGRVLSGLAMLVHQALLQVRIFVTGTPQLPVEKEPRVLAAMLAAVHLDPAGNPLALVDTGTTPPSAVPES